ncbi:MAG: DUF4249 family protein [Flavobacteriaceae bacterium]
MRVIYSFTLLVAVLFISCQETVDADKLLDTEEKVSITSYISPIDTILRVQVSKVLPAIGTVFSNNDDIANRALFLIEDAIVSITDEDGNTADFSYLEEEAIYTSNATNLTILEGKQYFLSVLVNGQEFNATCTIPKKAPEILEIVRIFENEFGEAVAEIDLTFEDISGERNFYILGGFRMDTFDGESLQIPLFFESDGLLTDTAEDGITLGETTQVFLNQEDTGPKEVTLQIAHVNEILYQNIQTSTLNNNNDGNPFAEFSIAPNNIQGEDIIGVFAGYQISEKIIIIEQ